MARKLYLHTISVEGGGEFPIDMMRYDRCWPATEADSGYSYSPIRGGQAGLRTVRVQAHSGTKVSPFTDLRWASFGWRVQPDSHRVQESGLLS